MTESRDEIALELLVNTVLRMLQMEHNKGKDRFQVIREAYLLIQNCRDELKILREEEQGQIALSKQALEIENQKKVPFEDALKQILGSRHNEHYRERFEKYINQADARTRRVSEDFGLGVPLALISSLKESFWKWNESEAQKSKVKNAKRPRKRKKSIDRQKMSSLSESK
jgi:hypothetical protein